MTVLYLPFDLTQCGMNGRCFRAAGAGSAHQGRTLSDIRRRRSAPSDPADAAVTPSTGESLGIPPMVGYQGFLRPSQPIRLLRLAHETTLHPGR